MLFAGCTVQLGKNKDIPTDPNTLQNWILGEAAFCQLAGKSDNVLVTGSQESVQNGDSCATVKKASAIGSKGTAAAGAAREAVWRPTPQRFVFLAAGHRPGPCGGREAGVQLRPPLPPRGRQDARGYMRARSAGSGCRAAGIRPGGQAGSDHGHGAPSHPIPSHGRRGAAALGSSLPRPGAARSGRWQRRPCASRATSSRGPPASAPAQWRRRSPSAELSPPTAVPAPPQRWSATPPRCRHRSRPGERRARPGGAARGARAAGLGGPGTCRPKPGEVAGAAGEKVSWPVAGPRAPRWPAPIPRCPERPGLGGTRCRLPPAPAGVPGCRGARSPRAAGPNAPARPSPAPHSCPPAPGGLRCSPGGPVSCRPRPGTLLSSEPRSAFHHVHVIIHCSR